MLPTSSDVTSAECPACGGTAGYTHIRGNKLCYYCPLCVLHFSIVDAAKKQGKLIVRRSRQHEQERAQETGGRAQRGSGSGWRPNTKMDVIPGGALTGDAEEHKETEARSFTLRLEDWLNARVKALSMGKNPRLHLRFILPSRHDVRLVVLPLEDYEDLMETANAASKHR